MDRTTNGDDGVEKQAEFNHLDQAPSKVSSEIDHDHGFTQEEQRSIIRRIDRRLVVTVGAMYCVSLMDRTNMSAANIAGMSVELQLTGFRYVSLVLFVLESNNQLTIVVEHRQLGLLHPLRHLSATVDCPHPQNRSPYSSGSHHYDVGCCHGWYGIRQEVPSACSSPSGSWFLRGWFLPQLCLSSQHMVHPM